MRAVKYEPSQGTEGAKGCHRDSTKRLYHYRKKIWSRCDVVECEGFDVRPDIHGAYQVELEMEMEMEMEGRFG